MDELRLKELKELRDSIIKKHIILIILSLIISLTVTIYFFMIKQNTYSLKFFFLLFSLHFPIYLFILFTTKNSMFRYQYITGISLILILCYSLSIVFLVQTNYYQFFCYLITLCIYHYTEFFSELLFHFQDIQKDAFLIYQNKRWVLFTSISFIETLFETYFFYEYKNIKIIFIIGLLMVIIGQYFRIAALFTGKSNFTHKIQLKKRKSHALVKHGIYSICRHPSYFGFYLWSVGIEIMCVNPICIITFSYVLFIFFKERIRFEEQYLIRFFGMEYIKYRREVRSLMPFINISKEIEKSNLRKYLQNHEDEENNEDIYNFLNDSNNEQDSDDDKEKED